MQYTKNDHTFVVCAYKESEYLERSIQSVLKQTVQSKVILSTSTPNEYITGIAQKYQLPVFVNTGRASIADDWNFGYAQADTELITLCHQDDIYLPEYLETALEELNRTEHPLIFFTDYFEIRNGKFEHDNKLLKIKRLMLLPLRARTFFTSRFVRRRILSFGCCICCPSVTFVKKNLSNPVFRYGMKSNLDWQAWETLSKERGAFVYCKKPLMGHRIHEDSTTSEIIGDSARRVEDLEMFERFWPKGIAKVLSNLYASSEKSNRITK